jgi:elongation factor P--(R)-beta-lysine ligase
MPDLQKILSARVIDIGPQGTTLQAGSKTLTVDWPDAKAPMIGDVFSITLPPAFSVLRQLASTTEVNSPTTADARRWTQPVSDGLTRHDILSARHLIKRAVRDYLHHEGFIEIDMPLLVRGTTPDAEVHSFDVPTQDTAARYLATSCEYQIKRMEIGGFDRLYTLTQNFRAGDHGRHRNPEFTMLEWARVGQSLTDIENDAQSFLQQAHKALGGDGENLLYQGREIDIASPWQRMTLRDAAQEYLNVALPGFSSADMHIALQKMDIDVQPDWHDNADMLFSLLFDQLQPLLGQERPVFIQEWPRRMTASAALDAHGQFTTRSELFIAGIELSDGFPTLCDPTAQKEGFASQQTRRQESGYATVELDKKFLQNLNEGLPQGAGMALGFDRLVMLLTDQTDIKSVLAFAWDEL